MVTRKTAAENAAEAKRIAAEAKLEAAKARGIVKGQSAGFFNFIREQGVIGLAVGLAVGTAAGATVKTIVDQLISPLVALLTQGVDLNRMKWVIEPKTAEHAEVALGYGAVISSLITLLATAFVVYLVIHLAKLDRLDRKKEAK